MCPFVSPHGGLSPPMGPLEGPARQGGLGGSGSAASSGLQLFPGQKDGEESSLAP